MDSPRPSGRIVIAGGSGFVGQNLARHLTSLGYDVVILSRRSASESEAGRFVNWDARSLGDWIDELDGAAAVVNLVGRTVDCVKSPPHCDEIIRSRVEATSVIGRALNRIDAPPPVWAQMSTAHIYGDPPTVWCDEDSALGYGLAPMVGQAWENSFADATTGDIRKVVLRTSFVLGQSGGALPTLVRLTKFGLGGAVGSGQQGISWLHELDMSRLFERAITDESMRGVYMATAPNPVSNRVFMRTLRRVLRIPIGLPAPAPLVRLGAPLVLRTDPELAIYGRYCISKRLPEEGFQFEFSDLEPALRELLNR